MKRYYYITILAVCAISLFQVVYVRNLYNHYIDETITNINNCLSVSVDKEQHLRSLRKGGRKPKKQQYMSVRFMEDMSPQEKDSLLRLHPLPSSELYNIDVAREKGIVKTSSELAAQLVQDRLLEEGLPLDLKTLDSIFAKDADCDYSQILLLYNSDREVFDSIGKQGGSAYDYTSNFIPIGTKGLQYLQIKADIPLFPFIRNQAWALILSVILMIFVVLCMAYHLTVIRWKDALLQKREGTINGTIHDLKNPLNSVVATLGWLKSDETNLAKREAVEISQAEVKHLVCNIESLLVTVRKDRKQLVLKKEDIDIAYIVKVVKSNMDALYRTKLHSITIEDHLPEGITVFADGMYIENVIRNLVENALKYSDDGVKVEVALFAVGGMLQVVVRDNGWGIAPKYQKKLFHQFYQVPRGEEKICKGYGIGLAQSKYIIDAHKGKFDVKSAEGEGSVFTFIIPLV